MSRIEVGEMEELPFADAAFDAVTSFNAFQFAGDPGRALREAGRVCRQGGTIAMLVWGPKDDCDLSGTIVPVENAVGSFTGADGSVILRNRFHWVTATAGSAGLS